MENNYKEDLKNISTFIFDVDGVLTDGSLLIDSEGNMLRKMNVKDGYALKAAIDSGYNICIISGGTNESVKKRFEDLGIKEIHLGSHNKIEQLNSFIDKYNLDKKNILVKNICSYVSHKNGGMGAVRDVIEQVMKIQNNWAK